MDQAYRTVRAVGRFWLWFFLRSVEVRQPERVPRAGPVLLAINHPNNVVDSLLVAAVVPRHVHFLATATLFRRRPLRALLAAMGVIPVYRRQDDPGRMARNSETFAACFRVLDAGGVIAIYPEGTTHAEPRVQRIRTGAARIALEAEARHEGRLGLTLLPVGLNFEARKAFRARVLVSFGEPIPLGPWLPAYRETPSRAVEALTTVIQHGMETQVIHVARLDLTGLVREIEALYRADLEREVAEARGLPRAGVDPFRLSRTIVAAVHHFSDSEPARLERIARRIEVYRALLAAHRLRDAAVRQRLRRVPRRRPLALTSQVVAGLPLFAYGAAVNALPYYLPRWLARRWSGRETDYATVRLLASVVAFPVVWAIETWIVERLAGAVWALAFALSLPLSGLAAYRYLGGLARLREGVSFGLVALRHRQAAGRLLEARQDLVEELDRAKRDYLAATRGSPW